MDSIVVYIIYSLNFGITKEMRLHLQLVLYFYIRFYNFIYFLFFTFYSINFSPIINFAIIIYSAYSLNV